MDIHVVSNYLSSLMISFLDGKEGGKIDIAGLCFWPNVNIHRYLRAKASRNWVILEFTSSEVTIWT